MECVFSHEMCRRNFAVVQYYVYVDKFQYSWQATNFMKIRSVLTCRQAHTSSRGQSGNVSYPKRP